MENTAVAPLDPTVIPGHSDYLNLPLTAIGLTLRGTIIENRIHYGFCKVDFEEHDPSDRQYQTFIVPAECRNVGDSIPPVGARIQFTIVADAKSGRPRASQVEVAPGEEQATGVGVVPEDMWSFIERWGLGPDAQGALNRCAPDVQQVIMSTFAPKDHNGNNCLSKADLPQPCDGKFILFCRSVAIGKGVKGGGQNFIKGGKGKAKGCCKGKSDKAAQMQGTVAELQASVRAFIDTWNLSPDAQTVLSNLNLQVAVETMKNFRPLTMTGEPAKNYMDLCGADCSGLFCDFARNMEEKMMMSPPALPLDGLGPPGMTQPGMTQPGMNQPTDQMPQQFPPQQFPPQQFPQQVEPQLQSLPAPGMVDPNSVTSFSQIPQMMAMGSMPGSMQPEAMGGMRFSPY